MEDVLVIRCEVDSLPRRVHVCLFFCVFSLHFNVFFMFFCSFGFFFFAVSNKHADPSRSEEKLRTEAGVQGNNEAALQER